MGYYEDERFGQLPPHKDSDARDAGLQFVVDAALASGLNLNPADLRNLRDSVTLGSKGATPGYRGDAMNAALDILNRGPFVREFTDAQGRRGRIYRANTADQPFMFAFTNYGNITEPVSMREEGVTDRLVLPVPPETFSVQSENSGEEVTSVLGLTYNHAGPIGLAEMTIEGIFPYIPIYGPHPTYVPEYVKTYGAYTPGVLCAKFITAMNSGQPIEFTVSDPKTQSIVMPTRLVVVTSFEWEVRAGHGQDRFFTMSLKEWIPQQISIGSFQPGATKSVRLPRRLNLFNIADRAFRPKFATKKDRNRWREVYNLNKGKIDAYVRGVRNGTVNPITNKEQKKNEAQARRFRNYKVSARLVLPKDMVLQLPVGADINAVQKKIS